MNKYDIAIIGGSVAGRGVASILKKLGYSKKIAIFRKEEQTVVPCGIPYIFGKLGSIEKNKISDEPLLKSEVDIKIGEVREIDFENKILTFGKEKFSFEQLVFATGSKPFVPPLEGIELENIFTIKKNIPHLEKLFLAIKEAQNIVIIGGGFIGVEMAEQIAEFHQYKTVTIIELLPHCLMAACEQEFCEQAEKELKNIGVNILTNAQVIGFEGDKKVERVILKDGSKIKSDLVIIGIGAIPNIDLAANSGIDYHEKLGIKVDKNMKTSKKDVFAAGDCTTKFSLISGNLTGLRLASIAGYEALLVANNIIGNKIENQGVVGAFATKIGKLAIASSGFTTQTCDREGIEYVVGEYVGPDRHPGTFEGTFKNMKVKLIFRKEDGVIIGGHILGGLSSADINNILSLMIKDKKTVEDIYLLQVGTHPLLTGGPLRYHIIRAAEDALLKLK